jgi:2-amino-4-hydroxy-6-hydroxymethyldihydropteridine diphosphokinase
MNTAYILLGSNLGDKKDNLTKACEKISSVCGNISKRSSLYETSPWGYTEQSFFLNAVIELQTVYSPERLLELLLEIEIQLGRVRIQKWGERLIDLDILYYDQEIINSAHLKIPHPELHNRKFTLIPLCEIAPGYVHPLLQRTNAQLLEACKDDGIVTKSSISL